MTFEQMKQEEARQRMADLKAAKKSKRAAERIQRRNALIKDASKWEITNWEQALKAMANRY